MGGGVKIVASGAAWSVAYNIVNAIYGFVAIPILINYFGKAEYGLIGIAQSVNVYIQLLDMGMNSTNVRFFSVWLAENNHLKVRQLFQTSLALFSVLGLLNAVILLVVSCFSSSIFNVTAEQDVILKQLLYILSFAAILQWYSSCFDQLIRGTENVAWIQKRFFVPKAIQIIVLILTVFYKFSLPFYFILTTCSFFAILPLSVAKIKKVTPFVSFIPKFHMPTLKEILPYTANIFIFHFFKFSFIYLCPIFLGIWASMETVTEYKVIHTVASLIGMVTGVVMGALLPSSSRVTAQNNMNAYYHIAYQGTKYISIVTCICVFGLITIAKDLLVVYVGESYLPLTPCLYVLALIGLGNHIVGISSLILAKSNIKALSRMVVFSASFALLASWFSIPYIGIWGVILGQVLYEIMQELFYYIYYIPRKMEIKVWKVLKSFLPFVFIGFLLCFVSLLIPHFYNHWTNILVFGSLFTVLFVIILAFALNEDDKAFIKKMIDRN